MNTQDVNIALDFRTAPGQPTVLITDTVLLSTGVATHDVVLNSSGACYPGYFSNEYNGIGAHPRRQRALFGDAVHQQFLLAADRPRGEPDELSVRRVFLARTETSYAAAAAAGEDVANTGWFAAGLMTTAFPLNSTFEYMPSVVLQPALLSGDANGDGRVDVNDLTIVLSHFGQTGMTWAQGEFTGDGTVDVNDLTIVLAHYGQSLGSSAGPVAAVPEPGALRVVDRWLSQPTGLRLEEAQVRTDACSPGQLSPRRCAFRSVGKSSAGEAKVRLSPRRFVVLSLRHRMLGRPDDRMSQAGRAHGLPRIRMAGSNGRFALLSFPPSIVTVLPPN